MLREAFSREGELLQESSFNSSNVLDRAGILLIILSLILEKIAIFVTAFHLVHLDMYSYFFCSSLVFTITDRFLSQ